ncbi:GlsB/YeaQ/YmgE family stress response membrane protein [Acidithiobacillus sulfuriphilus]|uniref:GlsB/YeaQ/YmgE family stress response membrane protein n=2 Tax=Acidithiobacillus sulfuriphilus TaxID=1867749 RepID=A0A3M8QS04_9PROT|nr:GlsB/YeaQ/YmgE family stress response membrane protein [Acidithiobacillus sulfuriphilus]RNF58262.1 GlsB/YeaQ/YmgE family stress response membrane protein [Acidithiobacillus sulfuriphilus]
MTLMSVIVFLIIGAAAGWLAGVIVKGRGFGVLGDIVIGIIGAFLGGFLLIAFGLAGLVGAGVISAILVATLGAVILLVIVKIIKKL